jgi:hypothetical protein
MQEWMVFVENKGFEGKEGCKDQEELREIGEYLVRVF